MVLLANITAGTKSQDEDVCVSWNIILELQYYGEVLYNIKTSPFCVEAQQLQRCKIKTFSQVLDTTATLHRLNIYEV